MNQIIIFRFFLIIACFLFLSAGIVQAEDENAAFVYGNPPTAGKILLKLVNNEADMDVIAVLTKGGDKTPLFAIYIPSEEVGAIKNMEKGRYDVYFTTGIDWNEDNVAFNDGQYYKLKSPLILGDKTEYQVQLFADEGKMGTRIKHIDESVFPDISGPSYSSESDTEESDASKSESEKLVTNTSGSWGSGNKKPVSVPLKE